MEVLSFKINDKVLRDSKNNVITLKVVNGIAKLEYDLTGYNAKTYTLSAVFGNSSFNRDEISSTLTVTKETVTINLFQLQNIQDLKY